MQAPEELSQILGLTQAKRVLQGLAEGRAQSHALLLYGVRGVGKTLLADWMTQVWLCESLVDGNPCGECGGCRTWLKGNCADVLRVDPRGTSSNIVLGQIIPRPPKKDEDPPLPIQTFIRTPPLMARHKVVRISGAERMTEEASVSLLKMLEEPPSYVKFILVTTEVGRILPTIQSRCLSLACQTPSDQELLEAFGEATPEERRLSRLAPGALKQLRGEAGWVNQLNDFVERVATAPRGAGLVLAEAFAALAKELEDLRGLNARAANAEAVAAFGNLISERSDFDPDWQQRVCETHRRILQNAQPGIVFDALFTSAEL